MTHLRARTAVRLLTEIREKEPQLFAQIQDFRRKTILGNEAWYCNDCFNTGPLDIHGRCERCGSQSVSPAALVMQ